MPDDTPTNSFGDSAKTVSELMAHDICELSTAREVPPYLWLYGVVMRKSVEVIKNDTNSHKQLNAHQMMSYIRKEAIPVDPENWADFVDKWCWIKENIAGGSAWADEQGWGKSYSWLQDLEQYMHERIEAELATDHHPMNHAIWLPSFCAQADKVIDELKEQKALDGFA